MASSLDRIFSKTKSALKYEPEQDDDFTGFSSGSETETVSEERDSGDDYEEASLSGRKKRCGGIAPVDGKLQRNPTRRPNPKISNRNALLARENRRRKKQHVENLEREVEELKESNGKIRKALKKKTKLVDQLIRERNYLKSVIANRTGIMAVLKSVQRTGLPMTSSSLSYVTESPMDQMRPQRIAGSSSDEGLGLSPHSMMQTDDGEEDAKFNPHDLGTMTMPEEAELPFEDEFSRLPDVDELLLSTMAGSAEEHSAEQVITTEHNYFEHSNHSSLGSGSATGVCVHIVPGGRVSVEFCASCALSSQRAWLEEAEER